MKDSKGISRILVGGILIIVVIVASIGVYAGVTYPRTILSFTVSFTIGADSRTEQFNVPFLDSWAQVEIDVASGTALWLARIQSGNTTFWNQGGSQGSQTTFNSGWIQLNSGSYNLSLKTFGIGSLDANVRVTSKGGFW